MAINGKQSAGKSRAGPSKPSNTISNGKKARVNVPLAKKRAPSPVEDIDDEDDEGELPITDDEEGLDDEEEDVFAEQEGLDSEEDELSDSDEREGDVSSAGLKRLMELVGDDLDPEAAAQLALLNGEDSGEDGEEQDSGEDGYEELDGEEEDEDEDEDAVEEPIPLKAVHFEDGTGEEDEDEEVAMDEVDSDFSVDEDAVPQRKVVTNNKPALKSLTEDMMLTSLPWAEHLIIKSRDVVECDPSDDLQREMAFYKIALDCIPQARKLASRHDIPFSRPNDYYAEMVKSDEHMERVRTKLVEESQGIKKSEEAKKQRDLKKYGKQIQMEKLKQREMDKKGFKERMQGVKRKRKEGMDLGESGGDDFGVEIDDAIEGRPARGSAGRGRGRGGQSRMPRSARDAKYSLGGGGRRSKQNTKESTNDFAGWSGGKPSRGGSGGRGGKAQRGKNRPGKSRRQAAR